MQLPRLAWICVFALLSVGCKDNPMQELAGRAQKMKQDENRKIMAPKELRSKAVKKRKQPEPPQEALDAIERAFDASRGAARQMGSGEAAAIDKVATAIRASLELGPTLVVWLVDRTPSAQSIVNGAIPAAQALYDAEDIRPLASATDPALLSAVIAFDDKAEFLLDPPVGDAQQVQAAFDKIQPSTGGKENTFAAIGQALDKYLAYRTDATQRREVLLVVITDEAGDDGSLVEGLAEITRRNALPVYCLGSPAPWGQANPTLPDPKQPDASKSDDSAPVYGPESFVSERVGVSMVRLDGEGNGFQDFDLVDSGFGPFALERLCRAGGGQFFAIRPAESSEFTFRGQGYMFWPSGSELRFDPGTAGKYAPDYVSAEDHAQLLAENKARQALVSAARLPKLAIVDSPSMRFAKSNEAQMKRDLDRAQQFAAKHAPGVDRLYDALALGEADRAKLTGPRWQAQYDLAMGRILAAKARVDGYNSMIAALKRGKTFANAASTTWVLEPADLFETESTIRKLAERSKTYLERVVNEHPGTPWAKIAAAELDSPLGWTWKEM
ncbi:MAG: vWA domain-containing protein [Pirellulaceae bacterium]